VDMGRLCYPAFNSLKVAGLKWLQNFITGRTLQTKIDSSLSDIADL